MTLRMMLTCFGNAFAAQCSLDCCQDSLFLTLTTSKHVPGEPVCNQGRRPAKDNESRVPVITLANDNLILVLCENTCVVEEYAIKRQMVGKARRVNGLQCGRFPDAFENPEDLSCFFRQGIPGFRCRQEGGNKFGGKALVEGRIPSPWCGVRD